MKTTLKIILWTIEIFALLLVLYVILNFKLTVYGLSQLKGQLSIVWNAQPVEEVLEKPAFPDSLKQKILLIGEIRKFAIDSLGLKDTKNYTTLYDQKGKPLLMNLTASEKYKLKANTWNFPLLGNVSYKGFFNFEKGKQEAEELKKQDYDVEYSTVSAWSTLGWFRDPVFSGMLRRNEGQLAELIIHEMTHATIYLKSSVDFNENLASAIGETGAEKFLAFKFGEVSKELESYRHEQDDYNSFAKHMLEGTTHLDSLYRSIEYKSEDEKMRLKQTMIAKIVASLDTVSFHGDRYKNRFKDGDLPNNAYFLSFVRYDSQKDEMKEELNAKFHGSISTYLLYLKERDKAD